MKKNIYFSFQIIYFIVVITAAIIILYLSLNNDILRNKTSFFLFLFLASLAEILPINLPKDAEVTVGFAVFMGAILVLGTKASVWLAFIAAVIPEIKTKRFIRIPYNSFVNISIYIIMVGVSGYLFEITGGTPGKINILNDIIPMLVLVFSYLIMNISLIALALSILQKENLFHIFTSNFKWALPNYLALAPLGILLAIIYINVGSGGILLFLVPLLIARHSFQLYMNMRKIYLETIQALATAIEAKDPYTRGHSERVAMYSSIIAEEMNLPEDFLNTLNFAALLHDIGKIGIPDEILNKPGKLSEEEFDRIRIHPILGANIVEKIDFLAQASSYIRFHHERQNGRGYPEGLKGENIPLGAAILAVADAFDAMTSDRPYRRAWNLDDTLHEIESNSGIQFRPEVVEALKNAVKKGRIRIDAG
ncbi:HD-GYP domain-containing protein [Biomaibacter acetigenes]|uniref:HD-GYP domain-containing protein n=2 Tax=Biomaibacter acetigenes TaxID=2316383 RepID=A0A3G2R3K7_9FIRM|nr:HD-GYP domain-containing protein [Biomaibacter acetigenes]